MYYSYSLGTLVLGIIWTLCYWRRKDLRKAIIWSSLAYPVTMGIVFLLLRFVDKYIMDMGENVVPGYWNPHTYLNLAQTTGGLGIEDIFFMFFVGGIAAFLYEYTFGIRQAVAKTRRHHLQALVIGFAGAVVVGAFFKPNPIYLIITFGLVGAASIWATRQDLIPHSFWGGTVFATLYVALFAMFLYLTPDLLASQYNLASLSGHYILGVPLEELLYALSFGMLWAPLYEYEHGLRLRS